MFKLIRPSIVIATWFGLQGCAASTGASAPLRLTPEELRAQSGSDGHTGASGVGGVRSKVVSGDPSRAGAYSLLLFVPPNTTIQAHSHRDNRMASVLSGTWHFGYGEHFTNEALKTLPAGSVYSEPGGRQHFAQTGDSPVIVFISGEGPTDTRYFDPENDPSAERKAAQLSAPHAEQ